MSNSVKPTVEKYKLSALERILLKKMKMSEKTSWMIDHTTTDKMPSKAATV
jgi:hypothetical protein